jgi:hypothetical protein
VITIIMVSNLLAQRLDLLDHATGLLC